MIFIYGTRMFKKIIGEGDMYQCPKCNNAGRWQVIRTISWFTFFYIPIFPYYIKRYLICPFCQCGYKITGKKAKEFLALAQHQSEIEKDTWQNGM